MHDSALRAPRRRRSFLAAIAVSAIALSGVTLSAAAPAEAARETFSNDQREFVFDASAATHWTVPGGVHLVYVGLRGGDGGNAARNAPGGTGDNMVLRVPVTPGDTLTVHAGKSATGRTNDQRDGGLGYRPGGDGGKGSVDGKNAGGGGGAAALLVNDVLAAVAGGGGGNGGDGGKGGGHGVGGLGGSVSGPAAGQGTESVRTPGTNGSGGHPGAGAGVGLLTGALAVTRGAHGHDAANSSAGGGGGGGGGGWAGGESGHGGKRAGGILYGNSGGGGGASGSSMVTGRVAGVTRVTEAERIPNHPNTYRGPVAAPGTVKIVVPQSTSLQVYAPQTVPAGVAGAFFLRFQPRFADGRLAAGQVKVANGGVDVGTFSSDHRSWEPSTGTTFGTFAVESRPLSQGSHTFTADFSTGMSGEDFTYPEEKTTATVTIRALAALEGSVAVTGAPAVGETLTADVSALTSAAPLGAVAYQWYRGDTALREQTGPSYLTTEADSGHRVWVRVSAANSWGSKDSPRVQVLPQPTLTLTTDPEGTLTLPNDLTATATLASPSMHASGNAVTLWIDGVRVDSDETQNGVSTFTRTDLSPGSHTLIARYAGSLVYRPAESAPVVVTVDRAPQSIALRGLGAEYSADDSSVSVSVVGGSGTGEVSYASSDPAVASVSGDTVTFEGPGTFQITATKAEDDTYAAASVTSAVVTVAEGVGPAPEEPVIDISDAAVTLTGGPYLYSGAPIQPYVATVTLPDSTVLGDADYVVSYGDDTTNAGVGTLTVTGQGAYTGSTVRSFVIDPKPVTVIADEETMVFGGDAPRLDWNADPALAPGDVLTGALDTAGLSPDAEVGTYEITQGTLDLSNPNYVFTFVPSTFVVAPTEAAVEAINRVLVIPDPVLTLSDADLVAAATNAVSALTPAEREHLPQETLDALAAAQEQAGPVNQNDLEDGVASASADLAANWNLRLVVIPRTWDGSPEVNGRIAATLSDSSRLALGLYDLSFVDTLTGESWDPTEAVTIEFTKLPVADWDELEVIHELPDGTLETVPSIVKSGTVTFAASSFSLYGVTATYDSSSGGGDDGGGDDEGGGNDGGGTGGSDPNPGDGGTAGGAPGSQGTGSGGSDASAEHALARTGAPAFWAGLGAAAILLVAGTALFLSAERRRAARTSRLE